MRRERRGPGEGTSQTYDNTIHVDPCCPVTRNVTSRKAPAVRQSGMITRAVCGLVITNLFAQLCDADGCTSGLLDATGAATR